MFPAQYSAGNLSDFLAQSMIDLHADRQSAAWLDR